MYDLKRKQGAGFFPIPGIICNVKTAGDKFFVLFKEPMFLNRYSEFGKVTFCSEGGCNMEAKFYHPFSAARLKLVCIHQMPNNGWQIYNLMPVDADISIW